MASKNGSVAQEDLDNFGQQLKTEKIDPLSERIDKCYSADRYEAFQDAVEKIIERYLKGKVGWVIALWIISIVGSMLAQKFLGIF